MPSNRNEPATGNPWPNDPAPGNALLGCWFSILLMAALALVVAVLRWLI
jgi:hypothetical protein